MARTYLGNTEIKKLYVGSNNISKAISPVNYEPIVESGLRYHWNTFSPNTTSTIWGEYISGSNLEARTGNNGTINYTPSPNYLTSGYFLLDSPNVVSTDRAYFTVGGITNMDVAPSYTFQRTFQWWMNTKVVQHSGLFGLYSSDDAAANANFVFTITTADGEEGIKLSGASVAEYLTVIPVDTMVNFDWANYTITWDHPTTGLNTPHYFKGYVNGVLVNEVVSEFDQVSYAGTNLTVGAVKTGTSPTPNSNIEDTGLTQLLFYNTVLSEAQILQNYNATSYLYNRL